MLLMITRKICRGFFFCVFFFFFFFVWFLFLFCLFVFFLWRAVTLLMITHKIFFVCVFLCICVGGFICGDCLVHLFLISLILLVPLCVEIVAFSG